MNQTTLVILAALGGVWLLSRKHSGLSGSRSRQLYFAALTAAKKHPMNEGAIRAIKEQILRLQKQLDEFKAQGWDVDSVHAGPV